MNRKIIRIILTAVLAAVFIVSVGMMIYDQIQYRKTIDATDEAARIAGLPATTVTRRPDTVPATGNPAGSPTEGMGPSAEQPPEESMPPEWYLLPEEARDLVWLDLDALRETNKDVVGWIYIPGTIVSYPLMQGKSNQTYLRRNWKKESVTSGSIFIESECGKDLSDFHTIIYGHRMRNETMFGILKYYEEKDYWQEHPSVYIVLDDTIYRYDIFSANNSALDSMIYRLDIEEKQLEEELVQFCLDRSVLDTGLVPEPGVRILTLSTCTGNGYTKRWTVHGMLAEEYSRTNH